LGVGGMDHRFGGGSGGDWDGKEIVRYRGKLASRNAYGARKWNRGPFQHRTVLSWLRQERGQERSREEERGREERRKRGKRERDEVEGRGRVKGQDF
jgi:hypothetical protein